MLRTRRRQRALAVVIGLLVPVLVGSGADAHVRGDYAHQRKHLKRRARGQVGAGYRYGGTSPSGFDCSGLMRWVFESHGADLPHSSLRQYELGSRKNFKRIRNRGNLEIGDLVFHKTTDAKVGHAGIYIGKGRFISATSSSGVRARSIWDPSYWGPRWVGGVRIPASMRY